VQFLSVEIEGHSEMTAAVRRPLGSDRASRSTAAAPDKRNRQGKSAQPVSGSGPYFLCSATKPKTTAIGIGCTMPSQLFRLRQKKFKDIAPLTQTLMLKT
jgi:hypothetical protein